MNNTLIKNKIIAYVLILSTVTICSFSFYILSAFKNYGDKVLIGLLYFHAKQCENILYTNWSDKNDLDSLNTLVASMGSVAYNIKTEVIDKNGRVIAASRAQINEQNQLNYPEVAEAFQGISSSAVREVTNTKHHDDGMFERTSFVTLPLRSQPPLQFVIRLSSTDRILEQDFGNMLYNIFAAFALIMTLALIASLYFAKKIVRPLVEITNVANNLSQGHLEEKVNYQGRNEFGLLAHTLNNLSSNLAAKIKELSAEKQKQEMILEQMDNIVILADQEGRIVSINRQGKEIFGRNNSEIIGLHNFDVIGSSLLDTTVKECFSHLDSKIIDLQVNCNEGKYIFQVYVSPLIVLAQREPQTMLLVFHDITALLNVYERQIEFIANASHELATPLTSIKGFSETLLDGALQSPELSEKFVRIIYEESNHMQKLVTDMLQLTKLDSREYRQTIKLTAFDSHGILESVKDRLAQQISQKQLEVQIIYQKNTQEIYANPDWLKQALFNLLENAIKHSADKGKIALIYDHNSEVATFCVKDEGSGIAQENLPFLFERFYRTDKARARNQMGGAGIGLSVAKLAVELFDGAIRVESKVGVGSIFTVTIPLAKEDGEQ